MMTEDMEQDAPSQDRARIETVRAAIAKVADMLQQDWFFDEVAEALAAGLRHESKLICKDSPQGYVVALARSTKSKTRDNSFIRLDLA